MDPSATYSYDELVAHLGEPVATEQAGQIPGGGVSTVLVFACSCRGVPMVGGYGLGTPCEAHGGPQNVIRISDRRCGVEPLNDLDMEGTGVLGLLISLQSQAERDSSGCVDIAFDSDRIDRFPKGVAQLVKAGILRRDADQRYRLCYFNCFDTASGEWY